MERHPGRGTRGGEAPGKPPMKSKPPSNPRPDPRTTGRRAEEHAAEYLRRRGYTIVAANVRYKVGEIDLVAEQGQTLVFVEVRARRESAYGTAAETVNARKQARVWRAVETYLQEQQIDPSRPCRI